ncbi:hypothetical protein ES705_47016 [subsurface metagenome]
MGNEEESKLIKQLEKEWGKNWKVTCCALIYPDPEEMKFCFECGESLRKERRDLGHILEETKNQDIFCGLCKNKIGPNIIYIEKPSYQILITEFTEEKKLGSQMETVMLCNNCFLITLGDIPKINKILSSQLIQEAKKNYEKKKFPGKESFFQIRKPYRSE